MSAQGYSEEERAAAWAAYYAQQGIDPSAAASSSSNSHAGPSSSAQPAYYDPHASYTGTNEQFAAMPAHVARQIYAGGGEDNMLQQAAAYAPGATQELAKTGKYVVPGKRDTVLRQKGGRTWEDPSLLDWDPKWYRLFVGNVSNDVNERTLDEAFAEYPTFCKSKVVKDRLSLKSKYAFIAFTDPEDFLKAWKEMDGKYVGNRPIRLSKIRDDKFGSIQTQTVSGRKAKQLDKVKKNKGKPIDGRPVAW